MRKKTNAEKGPSRDEYPLWGWLGNRRYYGVCRYPAWLYHSEACMAGVGNDVTRLGIYTSLKYELTSNYLLSNRIDKFKEKKKTSLLFYNFVCFFILNYFKYPSNQRNLLLFFYTIYCIYNNNKSFHSRNLIKLKNLLILL